MLQFSECFINTAQKSYRTIGMVHTEGGWPKDVDVNEQAQTQRLIKRTERDEDYIGKDPPLPPARPRRHHPFLPSAPQRRPLAPSIAAL